MLFVDALLCMEFCISVLRTGARPCALYFVQNTAFSANTAPHQPLCCRKVVCALRKEENLLLIPHPGIYDYYYHV